MDNNTLFEIFIFCLKIQLRFPKKIVYFFSVKNSWKCCGFRLFSCWQLWFHEKNWVKNSWKCFVKIEFFDKKIDFSNSVFFDKCWIYIIEFLALLAFLTSMYFAARSIPCLLSDPWPRILRCFFLDFGTFFVSSFFYMASVTKRTAYPFLPPKQKWA